MSGTSRRDSRGPDDSSSTPQVDQSRDCDPFRSLDTIAGLVGFVGDPTEVQIETRDPNDDYLIALARANDVEVIISGDKDLLDWEPQQPPVVTPAQFEQSTGAT